MVIQLQTNYKNEDTHVIVEILKFCRCPPVTKELIQEVVKNYILKRADKMKYKNILKSFNESKRYVIIVSGNDPEINKNASKIFNDLFYKYVEEISPQE